MNPKLDLKSFALRCKNRTRTGERVAIFVKDELLDLPYDGSKTFYIMNDNKKGLVGVYDKYATVEMIEEDVLAHLKGVLK